MAVIGTTGPPWRLRLYCNYRRWGWSEVYWLTSRHFPEATRAAYDLANRRRFWFGRSCTIHYACMCRGELCDDTWALDLRGKDAFPPGRWPQPNPPNDAASGWLYREESESAGYGQRLFRCVPDDWIADQWLGPGKPGLTPLLAPPPPIHLGTALVGGQYPVLPAAGVNLTVLQRSFLDVLLRQVGFLRKNGTADQDQWSVEPLVRVLWRSVSQRPKKHAWKRVSCEPGVRCVNGFWVGPLFSFCGMCVGVVETCYYAPARWYVGGPDSGIRFYVVPNSNPLYLGQLRFGPKISEPGYKNLLSATAAGEITGQGARPYYLGTDVDPSRDGTHPEVTPGEAAGQAPWVWEAPHHAGLAVP